MDLMDAIAMAVFGGISSTGGKGNLAGGLISAFIIVCLRVGLGQRNVHAQVILLIIELLICAVLPNIIENIKRAVKIKQSGSAERFGQNYSVSSCPLKGYGK